MFFSFNPSNNQQLSFWDSYESLTEREKSFLEKSWAKDGEVRPKCSNRLKR